MRRVPKNLSAYDSRKLIRISLKTSDEREASKRAAIYDDFIEKYWRDLVRTESSDQDLQKYRKAVSLAQAHGFAYKDMSEIASGPLEDLLSRTEIVEGSSHAVSQAILGAVKPARLSLKQCPDTFWPLCSDRFVDKSDHQIHKYKNPRNAAMKNFISAVGNLDLASVDRKQVLKFRSWLMDRVAQKLITGHTANKQLRHIKDMLWVVSQAEELEIDFRHLFADIRLSEDIESRPPFENDYVQRNFMEGDSLSQMNEDARAIIHMMIETGARPKELIGLTPEDYFIDEPIPHIWIRKNKIRGLKNKTTERKIPLNGISLAAAQKYASTGITRYQKNPDTATAAISKYFRENNLKPTPRHSMYSLRHTFKDRLRDVGAPEEVIDELMGHKTAGPKYGRGHLLETKQQWLEKITFEVPPSVKK